MNRQSFVPSKVPRNPEVCSARLQRKLSIGSINDPLEQEADRIADQVMATPAHSTVSGAPPRLQRFVEQPTGQMDEVPGSVHQALASPGRPLEPALRQDMQRRFGYDFSSVRVHSGAASEQSAREVNSEAYTVGAHVVFAAGQFQPSTHEGRRLLAHELTHVVQQWHGAAPAIQRRPDGPGGRRPDESRESPEEPPSIVMIVASPGPKSSAVATLSNGRVESVKIDTNTLEPGEYTFQRDPSAPLNYRLVGRREGQEFVWRKKPTYRWADKVQVFIRLSPAERIGALPPHLRNFLTTTRSHAPKATRADLVSIASAGRILETYGVTEDELSLIELAEADRRGVGLTHESDEGGDPVGWARSFVEGRQAAAAEAGQTREVLKQSAAQFGWVHGWRDKPAAAAFERASSSRMRAVASSILNATEAAIYRMDQRFIGAYQPEGLGPGFLSDPARSLAGGPRDPEGA